MRNSSSTIKMDLRVKRSNSESFPAATSHWFNRLSFQDAGTINYDIFRWFGHLIPRGVVCRALGL